MQRVRAPSSSGTGWPGRARRRHRPALPPGGTETLDGADGGQTELGHQPAKGALRARAGRAGRGGQHQVADLDWLGGALVGHVASQQNAYSTSLTKNLFRIMVGAES